jgi:sulfate adenylyltransferase
MQLLVAALLISSAAAFRFGPKLGAAPRTQLSTRTGSSLQMISTPHGGSLVNKLLKSDAEKDAAIKGCDFSLELDERQLCDVEQIMQGGFSPLGGYMGEEDYNSVVSDMKLTSGLIFGLPVVFDTNDERVKAGAKVLLTYKGTNIATFDVSSRYTPNKPVEALKCYGTSSIEHPAVLMITTERGKYYCGGDITGLNVPVRDFPCQSPEEVRSQLPKDVDIVAFQCRNPIHRAHYEVRRLRYLQQ